jgi:HK97 family phage prohead protease
MNGYQWLESFRDKGGLVASPAQYGIVRPARVSEPSYHLRFAALRCGSTAEVANQVTLSGLCVPYEQLGKPDASGISTLFKRGCFARTLQSDRDQYVLFNFLTSSVLGRVRAGTARIFETLSGLSFECTPPDSSFGQGILVSVNRGDITGSAAALNATVSHVELRAGARVRIVQAADLISVSVCSFAEFDLGLSVSKQHAPPLAAMTPADHHLLSSMGIKGLRP